MKMVKALKNKKQLLLVPLVVVASAVGVNAAQSPVSTDSHPSETTVQEVAEVPTTAETGTTVAPNTQFKPTPESPTVPTPEPTVDEQTPAQSGDASVSSETPVEEPTPEPEPVYVVTKTPRFVKISETPGGEKVVDQYCDYTYSDGTADSKYITRLNWGPSLSLQAGC